MLCCTRIKPLQYICKFIIGSLVRFWNKILQDVSQDTSTPYKILDEILGRILQDSHKILSKIVQDSYKILV